MLLLFFHCFIRAGCELNYGQEQPIIPIPSRNDSSAELHTVNPCSGRLATCAATAALCATQVSHLCIDSPTLPGPLAFQCTPHPIRLLLFRSHLTPTCLTPTHSTPPHLTRTHLTPTQLTCLPSKSCIQRVKTSPQSSTHGSTGRWTFYLANNGCPKENLTDSRATSGHQG